MRGKQRELSGSPCHMPRLAMHHAVQGRCACAGFLNGLAHGVAFLDHAHQHLLQSVPSVLSLAMGQGCRNATDPKDVPLDLADATEERLDLREHVHDMHIHKVRSPLQIGLVLGHGSIISARLVRTCTQSHDINPVVRTTVEYDARPCERSRHDIERPQRSRF